MTPQSVKLQDPSDLGTLLQHQPDSGLTSKQQQLKTKFAADERKHCWKVVKMGKRVGRLFRCAGPVHAQVINGVFKKSKAEPIGSLELFQAMVVEGLNGEFGHQTYYSDWCPYKKYLYLRCKAAKCPFSIQFTHRLPTAAQIQWHRNVC